MSRIGKFKETEKVGKWLPGVEGVRGIMTANMFLSGMMTVL